MIMAISACTMGITFILLGFSVGQNPMIFAGLMMLFASIPFWIEMRLRYNKKHWIHPKLRRDKKRR